MIYRTLRPDELPKWFDHCQSVFALPDTGYFRRHYESDPTADCSLVFVAMDGEEIASTVRVFDREIWISGLRMHMGGIGEVSTKPAYRRQGLVGNLLQIALDAMAARGMIVSILFGSEPLYQRMGWIPCAADRLQFRADAFSLPAAGHEIRSFQSGDLPLLMGMYDLYAGRLDGGVIRSQAYWQQWILPQWTPPQVLISDGLPVAYACVDRDEASRLRVTELCAAPQAEALLPGFLCACAQREEANAIDLFRALLPDVPGTIQPDSAYMIRLNTPTDQWANTGALISAMDNPGMFSIDHF